MEKQKNKRDQVARSMGVDRKWMVDVWSFLPQEGVFFPSSRLGANLFLAYTRGSETRILSIV